MTEPSLPKVVSQEKWQRDVDQLRIKEKEITRATDAMSHPAHLNARDTSLVLISSAPLAKLLDLSWPDAVWQAGALGGFPGSTAEGKITLGGQT